MHLAVAVGTLLLGGWVLDSSSQDQASVHQRSQPSASTKQIAAPPSTSSATPPGGARSYEERSTRENRSSSAGGVPRQVQPGLQSQQFLPDDIAAPTETASDSEMASQPMQPTASPEMSYMPGRGMGGRAMPHSPTGQRGRQRSMSMAPSSTFRARSHQGTTQQDSMLQQNIVTVTPPVPATEKAFANFQQQSGVSPYMNLYRRDSLGTVDNYTTLVRPQLEQRYINNQVNNEINTLQRNTQMQVMSAQQPQRQQLQGVSTPAFYMNYGQYYPGFEQLPQSQGQ